MTERWLPIPGWEGLYEVSDQGRVRGIDRTTIDSLGRPHPRAGRVITPKRNMPNGRLYAHLYRGSQRHRPQIHRLVLQAFVGPCPPGMVGCHYDDDPLNNHLSNLRWDTHSGNQHDAVRNGGHPEIRKTHCPSGHSYAEHGYARRNRSGGMSRYCRVCENAQRRRRRHRIAAALDGPP